MAALFKHSFTVAFADTDMAGIVHFSNYMRYLESAEAAFWNSIGFSLLGKENGTRTGWPRIDVSCTFKAPLRYNDTATTHLFIQRVGTKSISWLFAIYKDDQILVALARMTTVYATIDGEKVQALAIPEVIRTRLQVADNAEIQALLKL